MPKGRKKNMIINVNPTIESLDGGHQNEKTSANRNIVDTVTHGGLRGVAAVWVMVFHAIIYSTQEKVDFQGSSIMPLFFALSGFSLMLGYDKGRVVANLAGGPQEDYKRFWCLDYSCFHGADYFSFIRNRFARTYPTYLVTCMYAIPLWFFGDGIMPEYVGPLIVTFTLTTTGLGYAFGSCINGPGWTICTLMVMWLFFPWSAHVAKRLSINQLYDYIVYCFYIQLVLVYLIFVPSFIITGGNYPFAFSIATMVPYSR